MSNWEITLINQTDSVEDLWRGESFWQYELNTFQTNGLNERDVALFLCVLKSYYILLLLSFLLLSSLVVVALFLS